MGVGSWIVFSLSIAAWISIRATVPMTENHRALMWASTVSLLLLPVFIGNLSDHVLVSSVWWPFLAGLMAGEFLWTKWVQRKARKEREKREAKERIRALAKSKKRSKSED